MNEDVRPWTDIGGDPDSFMQTRQVWGGGMDGLDLDEWNVAIWRDGKPALAFHKVEHRMTFDPEVIDEEKLQDTVEEILEELETGKPRKKRPKAFWKL